MNFGKAIKALQKGNRVARKGWNGKGLFVYLVPAAAYPVQTEAAKAFFGPDSMVPYNPYFAIKNVDDTVSTWVPSVNDCLAKDWVIHEIITLDGSASNASDVKALMAETDAAIAETEVPKNPHLDYLREVLPLMEKSAATVELQNNLPLEKAIMETRVLALNGGRQNGKTDACKRFLMEFTPALGQEVGNGVYIDFRTALVYEPTLRNGEFHLAATAPIAGLEALVKSLGYKEHCKTFFVSGPLHLIENFVAVFAKMCAAVRSMFHPDFIIVIDK